MNVSLYTAAQARELDRLTIEQGGIAGYELMSRAGAFSFAQLQQHWPRSQRLLVLCGKGNNGGDGYVVAELARQAGMQVLVWSACDPQTLSGDAYQAYRHCQLNVTAGQRNLPLHNVDVVVDAMLGTGLQGSVRGIYAHWIEQVNQSSHAVLSIDIPSGLCADTGRMLGCALKADVTTTFIGRKQGLYTGQARDHVGVLAFSDLGVRDSVYTQLHSQASVFGMHASVELPKRGQTSYKTHHGHVFVVGGDTGTFGAVVLAAQGAARSGAGLVSIYTQPQHGAWVTMAQPELMLVRDNWQQASVLVVGPGLGQDEFGQQAFAYALAQNKPMVVDADALNLLAQHPLRRNDWLLTPHPGEAARLLQCSVADIEADRFAAVRRLQIKFGGAIILKGAGTVICGPSQHVFVLAVGNAGMASAGMGDVLAGVCGALLGQDHDVEEVAKMAAWLHSKAADLAAKDGQRGLLASDLLPFIRRLVA